MSKRPAKSKPEPPQLPLSSVDDIVAIAVDTNVYRQWGLRLRTQPLATIPEVKSLGVKWLIPEVWGWNNRVCSPREETERQGCLQHCLREDL